MTSKVLALPARQCAQQRGGSCEKNPAVWNIDRLLNDLSGFLVVCSEYTLALLLLGGAFFRLYSVKLNDYYDSVIQYD